MVYLVVTHVCLFAVEFPEHTRLFIIIGYDLSLRKFCGVGVEFFRLSHFRKLKRRSDFKDFQFHVDFSFSSSFSLSWFKPSPFIMSVFSRIKTITEADLSLALAPSIFKIDDVCLLLSPLWPSLTVI